MLQTKGFALFLGIYSYFFYICGATVESKVRVLVWHQIADFFEAKVPKTFLCTVGLCSGYTNLKEDGRIN